MQNYNVLLANSQQCLYADSILRAMELRDVFIDNLKKYSKVNKLSQMALAEKCGTSPSYIGEIEIGKKFPSVEMIQKLAAALNTQPYKLFMGENETYPAIIPPEAKQNLIKKLQQSVADIICETIV